MPTPARRGYIPVYDSDGNLAYYETDLPATPFGKKLRVGGHPQTEISTEKDLRRHKAELNWKEPSHTFLICKKCGKRVIREHATQKFCKPCGLLEKRRHASDRKKRQRKREKELKNAKKD